MLARYFQALSDASSEMSDDALQKLVSRLEAGADPDEDDVETLEVEVCYSYNSDVTYSDCGSHCWPSY